MSLEKVKIGIMGSGGYGATARHYLRNSGEFQIVACHDVNRLTAEKAAAEEGAVAYTDANQFLSHPQMAAVSINTPALLHSDHLRLCLEHDKHAFVTKPVTVTVAEARAVAMLARARRLAVVVGHHARFRPAIRLIQQMIEEGRLGRLCNVVVTSCSGRGITGSAEEWRFRSRQNPGGPLLQCGVHIIDILLSVLGPVHRVVAMCQDGITAHDVDDNYIVLLEFVSGVQVSLTSNYTTGYLHVMNWMGVDANLHLHEHVTQLGQCELFYQRRGKGELESWELLPLPVDPSYPDDHQGVLEKMFAAQVRTGQPDYANLEQAIAVMEVVEAAVQSAHTGKFVFLGPSAVTPARPKLETVIKATNRPKLEEMH